MASSNSPQLSDDDDDFGDEPREMTIHDDAYFGNEPREMTLEEEIEYYIALKKTEGFDMPSFPDSYACGRIETITGSRLHSEELQECADKDKAVDYFNQQNGTSFEFVKMVKATNKAVVGIMYYLTFEVKQMGSPPNSPTKTLQARVLRGLPIGHFDVELCRPEPSTSS
ncbi:uncharacterized protein LOC111008952 [Momordica charantia]|uniref:Uncharacterized protein LOC111008952 n=1 Tax=Momordica charantia TaxID=3673 RepID=A0A6J1C8H7_MOMCH|nr:uncharacterized protein LOC111008952 [Momordica charantia]XP_022137527.1 uncharacterized protein LOC111008952 [Momordica charantia]